MRRNQSGRNTADHAACGDVKVERGEISGRRPRSRKFAMAHQCVDEEHGEMHGDDPDDRLERIEDDHGNECHNERRLQRDREPVRNDGSARKCNDEGQQVKRERKHPEQRHRRYIG